METKYKTLFFLERSCFYKFVYSTETMLFLYFSIQCESHSLNWEARRDLTVADSDIGNNYYSATKNCCQMLAHFRVYKISSVDFVMSGALCQWLTSANSAVWPLL